MPVELQSEPDGELLTVRVTGTLKKEDYVHFVPEADRIIAGHHKVRMLIEMIDFHGWSPAAAWEDFKFGIRHFSHIERIAMVGDKKWEQWMATFCKPFTTAKVRFFPKEQSDQARVWVTTP